MGWRSNPQTGFAIQYYFLKMRASHSSLMKGKSMPANKRLLSAAKSKVAANKMAKSLAPEDLERALENLQAAAAKIKKGEAEKEERQRAANLKKLESMMAEMGLSAADVKSLSRAGGKKRAGRPKKPAAKGKAGPKKGIKVAPKYQLKVGKQVHKWTGRGRMPLVFKDHIAKSGSLEKCLIKEL